MKLSERGTVWQHRKARFVRVTSEVAKLESQNAALLEVVRDCVNFLADLNTTIPFDASKMVQRAKALHKRAYTAHSKAKSHTDTLKGE